MPIPENDERQFSAGVAVAAQVLNIATKNLNRQYGPQVVMVALHQQTGYMAASLVQTWRHHTGKGPQLTLEEFAKLADEVNEKMARYMGKVLAEAGVDVIVQEME